MRLKVFSIGIILLIIFFGCYNCSGTTGNDQLFNDISEQKIISLVPPGRSLPDTWRPFNDESPWNKPVHSEAVIHQKSKRILNKN